MSQDSKSSRRWREDKTNHPLRLCNSRMNVGSKFGMRMGFPWVVQMPGMAAVGVELVWSCDRVPWASASAVPESVEMRKRYQSVNQVCQIRTSRAIKSITPITGPITYTISL